MQSRMEVPEISENRTVSWFNLPLEIRTKVIGDMDTPTKCKFSRYSIQCYTEVGLSKNYIKAVFVHRAFHFPPRIIVLYDNLRSELLFNGKTVKIEIFHYTMIEVPSSVKGGSPKIRPMIRPLRKREIEVEEGEDAQSSMARYFGYILKNATNSDFTLSIEYPNFPYERTSIKHLRNLRKIENRVESEKNLIACNFLTAEQLNSIPEKIDLFGVRLNFEQLIQLKANRIVLHPIGLTSEEINRYLKLWANGQIHKKLEHLQLQLNGATLNKDQVIEGLELSCISITSGYRGRVRFKLRSLANPDRRVKVIFNNDHLSMTFDEYVPELSPEEKLIKYPKPSRHRFAELMMEELGMVLNEEALDEYINDEEDEHRYESPDEDYRPETSHREYIFDSFFD